MSTEIRLFNRIEIPLKLDSSGFSATFKIDSKKIIKAQKIIFFFRNEKTSNF
jgi:hypothetical protein